MSLIKDLGIIEQIHIRCTEIDFAHKEYDGKFETFKSNSLYRNGISLDLLQIGELSNGLSTEFKEQNPNIPWRGLRLFRNLVAHDYNSIGDDEIWNVVTNEVPNIKIFCEQTLKENKQLLTAFMSSLSVPNEEISETEEQEFGLTMQ